MAKASIGDIKYEVLSNRHSKVWTVEGAFITQSTAQSQMIALAAKYSDVEFRLVMFVEVGIELDGIKPKKGKGASGVPYARNKVRRA